MSDAGHEGAAAAWTTFAADTRVYPDLLESSIEDEDVDPLRISPNKERKISFPRVGTGITSADVVGKDLNRLGSR